MKSQTTFILLIISLTFFIGCKKSRIKNKGCGDASGISVNFDSGFIAMPNIFTPNGDGINDVLPVYAKGLTQFKLVIKKFSGKTVFETTSTDNWWNGRIEGEIREQLYKYELTATTINDEKISRDGTILSLVSVDDQCVEQAGKCRFGDMWHERLGYVQPTSEPLFEDMSCD